MRVEAMPPMYSASSSDMAAHIAAGVPSDCVSELGSTAETPSASPRAVSSISSPIPISTPPQTPPQETLMPWTSIRLADRCKTVWSPLRRGEVRRSLPGPSCTIVAMIASQDEYRATDARFAPTYHLRCAWLTRGCRNTCYAERSLEGVKNYKDEGKYCVDPIIKRR